MTEISITISKEDVYREIAQTTSYTGQKMDKSDPDAYDRIFTTDEDQSQLDRFWNESCVAVCEALKEFVQEEKTETNEGFTICLGLSSAFEQSLEAAIKKEMFSFFVINIISSWYVFTNKPEAAGYSTEAASMIEGIRRKVYHRKKPTRPERRVIT